MKKFLSSIAVLSVFLLAGCGSSEPLTEKQQAAEYNMTVQQYRAEKRAAARMGMTWEEHVKMLHMEGH